MRFGNTTRYEAARRAALADPSTSALKRARLTHGGGGLTQRALCVLAGVARSTLCAAESDPRSASRSTLRRLARALDVPYDLIAEDK